MSYLESIDSSPGPGADHRRSGRRGWASIAGVFGIVLVASGLASVACGGAATPDTTPLDTDRNVQNHDMHGAHMSQMGHMGKPGKPGKMGESGDEGEMGQVGEMAAMPAEVKKFHDTLAPRWHAEHGPQRITDTCTAIPQFHADAEAIAAATPPGGAKPADWSTNARQLTDAVTALDATCKAGDAAAFEQAFAAVHSSFHAVMAAGGESGDEHGKAEHTGH